MIAIYLACLLLVFYFLYRKSYEYWKAKGIAYDKPFLIFGSFFKVVSGQQHISTRIREIYNSFTSPYAGFYIFNQPNLLLRDPELIKRVLVKDFDKFLNRKIAVNEAVDPIAANTLFSTKDHVWKNLRAKISPVFTSGKMKLMLPLIKDCAKDMIAYLEKHNSEDINIEARNMTKRFTVDVIASCAFGINAFALKDENSEIMKIATKLLDNTSIIRGISTFSFFFVPMFVDIFRLTFLDKAASSYLIDIFKNTIKERQEKQISRNDLIDLLDTMKKNETLVDDYKFDDIKMAAQALVFFSAGNDTTSVTISFALYELALNKEMQDRLRQEIREAFEKEGDLTYEAIHGMKYLDMVTNETLRKYPLTNFLNRKSTARYTFDENLTIDKDVSLIIPIAGLHFDPKYFPNPTNFDPERFSIENKHKIVPFTFLPFGDGPRNCIGQRFGILVVKLGLIYSLKDFIFEPTDATPTSIKFDTRSLFLVNKGGLYLRAKKI